MTMELGAQMVLAMAVAVLVLMAGDSVSGAPLAVNAEALPARITARLKVVAGGNATCPWQVSLLDAGGYDGGRQLCTQELGVSFGDSQTIAEVPTPTSYTNSTTELPLLVGTQSSTSETPSTLKPGALEPGSAGPPPKGYVRVGGHGLYKLHQEALQWHEAREACEGEGAHLLVLDSVAEAHALRRFLAKKSPSIHAYQLGLHAGFRLDLRTVQGDRLTYETWPRSTDNYDSFCGIIDYDIWMLYGSCSQRKPFICKYEPQASKRVTETTSPTPTPAPSAAYANIKREFLRGRGYAPLVGWNGTYVKVLGSTNQGYWEDAKQNCEKDGAQLVTMESEEKADALFAFVESSGIDYFFLGVKTGDPVTVQGEPLQNRGYQRWATKNRRETCFYSRKMLYYSCPCRYTNGDGVSYGITYYTICQVNVNQIDNATDN